MRDQAAIGIAGLLAKPAWADSDAVPELRDALRNLSADPNAVVRMQAAHGLLSIIDADSPSTIVGHLRVRILQEQDENVLAVHLQTLRRVMATTPAGDVDQLIKELAGRPLGAFLRQDDPDEGSADADWWNKRCDVIELASAILTRLAVVDGALFSLRRLTDWLAWPLRNTNRTQTLIRHLQPYLTSPDGTGQDAVFILLGTAAHALEAAWRGATAALSTGGGEEASTRARDAALIAHQLAQQLDLAGGAEDDRSRACVSVARSADTVFADKALPLLRELSSVQHPQVIQPVVQALIHLSKTRPAEALQAIADAVSETGPYVTDPLAADAICPYLIRLLAENRDLVLGTGPGLAAFRHLLQALAGAGHPNALALAYTFSDSFR
jgi:hypothetical protein